MPLVSSPSSGGRDCTTSPLAALAGTAAAGPRGRAVTAAARRGCGASEDAARPAGLLHPHHQHTRDIAPYLGGLPIAEGCTLCMSRLSGAGVVLRRVAAAAVGPAGRGRAAVNTPAHAQTPGLAHQRTGQGGVGSAGASNCSPPRHTHTSPPLLHRPLLTHYSSIGVSFPSLIQQSNTPMRYYKSDAPTTTAIPLHLNT